MAELDAKGSAQLGGGQLLGIYHLSNCFYFPANSLYPRLWTKVPLVFFKTADVLVDFQRIFVEFPGFPEDS